MLDSSRKTKGLVQKDWHPGCTAITALLVNDKVYIANAGDCRAILCRNGRVVALSRVSSEPFKIKSSFPHLTNLSA